MATVISDLQSSVGSRAQSPLSNLIDWMGNSRRIRLVEAATIITLVITACITAFVLLKQGQDAEPLSPPAAAALLVANLLPATALLTLIGRRLAIGRAEGAIGESEGRLHVRLVVIFSLLAAIPALFLAIFASVLFQSGVQFWFSNSARGMLENAGELAKGYYEEKLRDVGDETVTMAGDLRYMLGRTKATSPDFLNGYFDQVFRRKLSESAIVVIGQDGVQRTAAVVSPDEKERNTWIDATELKRLSSGENMVVSAKRDRIAAIVPLIPNENTYLYASRAITVPSFTLGERAEAVLADYRDMVERSRKLQLQFNALLYVLSLFIIGIAVWVALLVADRLVRPVNSLVEAAQRIADGDFASRVDEKLIGRDEVGFLARSFNRMSERLEDQTSNLKTANRQLDERRTFIEAVLESVTAAIISVDSAGNIQLANATAEKLLSSDGISIVGSPLLDLAPHLAELVSEGKDHAVVQIGDGTEPTTLAVKIAEQEDGVVVTFEDITRQLSDQRRAAWSDVARRIAHEIKNPLTPIQLAAERLQRRFGKSVTDDSEIFNQLTGTIIRQVGDLRNIVDEFSSFARMPKPVFREEDMADIVGHAIFLFEVAHGDIRFSLENSAKGPIHLNCDRRQIGQAVTNMLKNAVEAIGERIEKSGAEHAGVIAVSLTQNASELVLRIADNGTGLPEQRERIFEPYVTTRKTGSGLGLAIVKKILEEHGATIEFADNPGGGTVVTTVFPETLFATDIHSSSAPFPDAADE